MKDYLREFKSNRLAKICCVYLFIIILFATVYFLLFRHNTANFYISEEYNERVLGRYLNRTSDVVSDIVDRTSNPFSIDDFNQKIKPINDSISHVYYAIDSLKKLEGKLEINKDILHVQLGQSRTEEIEKYRNSQLLNLCDSIDTFEKIISDSLNKGISEDKLIINGTYVRLAGMKVRYAKKNLEVSTVVLDNYGFFGDQILKDSLNTTVTAILENSLSLRRHETCLYALFNKYEDALQAFHRQRINKVGFLDFLHFSILIATSNSFGDILPNSPIARVLVSLQLLICIVHLAFILNILFS